MDDFDKKFDRKMNREKYIYLFFLALFVGYCYWDSYHNKHEWQDFYWIIIGFLSIIIYRLYQLDRKLDLILEKIYDLNH